jgi:hypothetical protein
MKRIQATSILSLVLLAWGCSDDGASSTGDDTSGSTDTQTSTEVGTSDATGDGSGTSATDATSGTNSTSGSDETSWPEEECTFDLHGAPEPVEYAGGLATPIDIKSIDVSFAFDLATAKATGDATVAFEMGDAAGRPILDLRQAIFGIELDGETLDDNDFPYDDLPYEDLGGNEDDYMRVVNRVLGPCSDHVLRLMYDIGSPQGGWYWSDVVWDPDSVVFRSSFYEMEPGNFAEKWMPANLIYDRFALTMQIEIVGDAVPHMVLANGEVEQIDTQSWRIVYPEHFTAFSPFFRLMAADGAEPHARVVTLPEGDVTIEGYFVEGADVTQSLDTLEAGLVQFRDMYGPYAHGDRFLAYVWEGDVGMEYAAGAYTGDDPADLSHRLFHSWFGRGVRPLTTSDSWWDEAWALYNTGALTFEDYEALPLDYPAKALYEPNPWVRRTHSDSFLYGAQVFATIREVIGAQVLIDLMVQFYADNVLGQASTADLQHLLYCQGGEEPDVLQIFHRLIYGNEGQAPAPPADYCI